MAKWVDFSGLIRHIWRVMKINGTATDDAVLAEIGKRLMQTRLASNLTQAQLAEQAGVSKRTVERLEAGAVATQLSGFIRVCRVLNVLERFEALIPESVPSPMAELKLRGKQRQRASGGGRGKAPKPSAKKWQWGDES
jgi:transcriptional regulator with XRE-family HTH domain